MKFTLSVFLVSVFATFASGNDATLRGISHSILLNETAVYIEGYTENILFTTYDGDRYSYPLYNDISEQKIYYSSEMKKLGINYVTDYYMLFYGTIDDYGELYFNFGSIDNDFNGIDDICEKQKSFNKTILGTWYSHDNTSGNITGTMIKNSNSQRGYYNLTIYNTFAGNIPASGDFYTGTLSGIVTYSKLNSSIKFNFTTTWDTQHSFDPFITSFDIIDNDSVRIYGKDFFPTIIVRRTGNKYSAQIELIDGGFGTFWPDYQKWYIEIDDNNDRDNDGVPDLSDSENNRKVINLPFLPLLLE